VSKYTARIIDNWDFNENVTTVSGIEFYNSSLILPSDHKDYEETFKNNTDILSLKNISAFSQLLFFNKIVNLTLGGRYDYSTEFGQSFVPRVALTKDFKNFYAKVMVSQSFRVPGGIITNRIPEGVSAITPEKATNYETEIGINTKYLWLSVNFFDIAFNRVIVYGSDPQTGIGTYMNSGQIGTYGAEAQLKLILNRFDFMINYAYYKPAQNDVDAYIIPNEPDMFLAFTNHRINSTATFLLTKKLSLNINARYYGKRYAFDYNDGTNDIVKEYPQSIILNSNIQFSGLAKHWTLLIGGSNLLDTYLPFIQPYAGEHAPLPSLSRSLNVKLIFEF
jgi:outer membrane receptor for ferrienterochelin and colicin